MVLKWFGVVLCVLGWFGVFPRSAVKPLLTEVERGHEVYPSAG